MAPGASARRRNTRACDEGFILLESMIAMTLIAIIMAGLTTFFVNTSQVTNELRATATATTIADSTVDQIRVLRPSDIYSGRASAAVDAQFLAAPSQVASQLTAMTKVSDDSGTAGKLPMSTTQTVNNISFTTTNYVGSCVLPVSPGNGTSCEASYPNTVAVANFLRVVVAVTWSDGRCTNGTCAYVTATLLSSDSDPNFLLNQTPPNAPVVTPPGNQTAAINDDVSLQLTLSANTGVNPNTWSAPLSGAGALPAGLQLSSTGLITGKPSGPVNSAQSSTVTVTDAFGRQASQGITWNILPNLVPSGPASWTGPTNTAITTITLSATGGAGAPFTWSVPAAGQSGALPNGLSMTSAGAISGTPTVAGTFTSVITVRDTSGRTRQLSIPFTVIPPPSLTSLASPTFNVMRGWTVANQSMDYSCPTATCTFALANAPAGIGLSAGGTGVVAASVSVTATSGRIYLRGAVAATAAVQSYSLTVTPTDTTYSKSGTAAASTWTITSTAGTGVVADTSVKTTTTLSQKLDYSCATACTMTFGGLLASNPTKTLSGNWLAPDAAATAQTATLSKAAGSGNFWIRGSSQAADQTGDYTVTVTITDSTGSSISTTATWTLT